MAMQQDILLEHSHRLRRITVGLLAGGAIWLLGTNVYAEFTVEEYSFFETKIRPVLAKKCYSCHSASAEKLKAELFLDTREGIGQGGESGFEIVVPGDPAGSLIIESLEYADLEMPPKEKLPDHVIEDFKKWINMGAPDPRDGKPPEQIAADYDQGELHWAFQPIIDSPPPAVRDEAWPRTTIDRFILAKLEAEKLAPVADASRIDLLRRVTVDLIGLPPTPGEIDAFVSDSDGLPRAIEKVVDRLLASKHFGERWARHWMDVARYGDSIGGTWNYPYQHAWRYRDYVIDSLNKDKPYDQFVAEQIAGDLLPPEDSDSSPNERMIATGFLAMGPNNLNVKEDEFLAESTAEQIDTLTRGLLGLSVACARCHDHKFDPISQREFYALAGILRSSELMNGYYHRTNFAGDHRLLITADVALSPEEAKLAANYEEELRQVQEEIDKTDESTLSRDELKVFKKESEKSLAPARWKNDLLGGGRIMGIVERAGPQDWPLHLSGDYLTLGEPVKRGFVDVLGVPDCAQPGERSSGRLELANWLTSIRNPLLSRVMANRVWHWLHGQGLVQTVDNFGVTGSAPSHPELLDHLAAYLVNNAWSTKKLIKYIVTSRVYLLDSGPEAQGIATDPGNVLLWRRSKRRLESEAIRDAILYSSGSLNLNRPRGSVVQFVGPDRGVMARGTGLEERQAEFADRRSVYQPVIRDHLPEFQEVFDFANPTATNGARSRSTSPSQALYMMNNSAIVEQAGLAAKRITAEYATDSERIEAAFMTTLARRPTVVESQSMLDLLSASEQSWKDVFMVLYCAPEFRFTF
jgi:hypothetical protein